MVIELIVVFLIGYLAGSVPTAYLVGRLVMGVDLRVEGEGNIGARNTFHVVGRGWGLAVFAADFAKGGVVALAFADAPHARLATATTAVLIGHCYPVWLHFVGGKGLSSVAGTTVALVPWAAAAGGAAAGVVWLARRRFLPTTVAAIVVGIVSAPVLGASLFEVGLIVWLFALTGVKRALDEPRMRAIEATTGWDRASGMHG